MEYITTTDLRSKTSKLKDSLKAGKITYIVHRSKIIGTVVPYESKLKTATKEKFKAFLDAFSVEKHLSYKERDNLRRKYLSEKYGTSVS